MKKIIYVSIISALVFSACEKSETGGCTDHYAINYESWADYDDHSCLYECDDPYATNYLLTTNYPVCEYEADVVFYEDVAAATYFDLLGINWLDVWVGNEYVGTLQANLGFTSKPDCYPIDPDAVHFTYQWEDASSTTFTWSVMDASGQIHYSGNDLILANNCLKMGLTWKKIKEYQDSH